MVQFQPTLVSDRLVDTVNFYEDFFGFVPKVEKEGYVLLQSTENPDVCISVFDSTHECIRDHMKPVQGVILNIAVDDVQKTYDSLYMEGLDIHLDVGTDLNGQKHFVVYDPNGVMVNIHEPMQLIAA